MNTFQEVYRKGFLLLIVIFVMSATQIVKASGSYNTPEKGEPVWIEEVYYATVQQLRCSEDLGYVQVLKDCTVNVSTEKYVLEITFYDVSWWTCAKLKTAAWWERNF